MPARKYATLNKKRIHKDTAFERTRENMAEFGRAGSANKLLRQAFGEVLPYVADRYISGRLTKRMIRIVHSDPVRGRGRRIVTAAALPMLEGFNFNRDRALVDTLYAPYNISFDRTTGLIAIHLPFFKAGTMVDGLSKAASCCIIGCAAAIDFRRQQTAFVQQDTGILKFISTNTRSIHLDLQLPANNPHPVIVALGVEFPGDKKFNAMAIVKVLTG